MAISRITAQDTKNNNAGTPVTTTYGTAPTVGNLLVASIGVAGTASHPTVADTDGSWTEILYKQANGATRSISVFAKIATGTATAVTATRSSANNMWLDIFEFSGASTSLTGQTNSSEGTTATSSTSPAITLAAADSMLFTTMVVAADITTTSVDSSYTKLFDNATGAIRTVDAVRIPGSTGTYSPVFSWTSARNWAQVHVEFLAAAAAGADPYPYVGGGYYPSEG